MERVAIAVLLLFIVAPVAASDPEEPPRPTHEPYHEGAFVWACYQDAGMDHDSGFEECWERIPSATFQVTHPDGSITDHAADGRGELWLDLPDGTYAITASATGFDSGSTTFEVPDAWGVNVRLSPQEIDVTGRLVDGDQNGIDATLTTYSGRQEQRIDVVAGDFAWQTTAGYHGFEVDVDGRFGWVHLFLDGSEPVHLMFETASQRWTLQGTVQDQHGEPVAGARIEAWAEADRECCGPQTKDGYYVIESESRDNWSETLSDEQGRYTMPIAQGYVHLNFWQDGYQHGWSEVLVEGDTTHDLDMFRMPEPDAHISGTIVDAQTGKPVSSVNMHIENQAWGQYACSMRDAEARDHERGYYHEGCRITIHADGTFSGSVMPGYSTIEVYAYQDCYDGCKGTEYIPHVQSLRLVSGDNGDMRIELQPFPAPTARLSGYILDEDDRPVAYAGIDFSNEETRGWGHATADEYGSFNVQLRPGWHRVSVWADGFYRWQGTVEVSDGGNQQNIQLVADPNPDHGWGYSRHPIAFAKEVPFELYPAPMPDGAYLPSYQNGSAGAAEDGDETMDETSEAGSQSEASASDVQDLGGLGKPYDPNGQTADPGPSGRPDLGIPGPALAVVLAALAAVVLVRRR